MNKFNLLVEFHRKAKNLGPGSDNSTKQALNMTSLLSKSNLKVLDVGCGTGASSISLAKALDAEVISVDLFQEFLDEVNFKAESLKLNIKTKVASMDDLPFNKDTFDVIWSEGAVYSIGFKKGVDNFKEILKPGGIMALSEITWLTDERPKEINEYWNDNYQEIATAADKIKILEKAGFRILGYFPLSKECWVDNYYKPMEDRFDSFLEKYDHSEDAKELVATEVKEISLYKAYSDYYSYGFYIAQKI